MQRKIHILFFLSLISCSWTYSQEPSLADLTKKAEFGLNVTNTLAGFFNSGGEGGPADPFLLAFKISGGRRAFRMGFDLELRTKSESGFSGNRDAKEQHYGIRIGQEWRTAVGRRIDFFWGLDVVGLYDREQVDAAFAFPAVVQVNEKFGVGGGPVAGIYFHLTPRLSLLTEAVLYGVYRYGEERFEEFSVGGGVPAPEKSTTMEFDLIPVPPNALYLYFRF